MATVGARQCHFVIRFPRQSFAAVTAFWAAPEREQVVTLAVTAKARAYVVKPHLPTALQVRVIKVALVTGEVEVGGTDLRDSATYPAAEFKAVYGWRWQHETYQDRIKNIFEVERFSGSRVRAIEQDFFGVLFLAPVESILSKPAQARLTVRAPARGCTTPLKVNRAVSYVALLDHVVELLAACRRTPGETLAAIEHLLQTTPTRHRAGRQFARKNRSAAHRLRFAKYGKRVLA